MDMDDPGDKTLAGLDWVGASCLKTTERCDYVRAVWGGMTFNEVASLPQLEPAHQNLSSVPLGI